MNKIIRIVVIFAVLFAGAMFVKNSLFGAVLSHALSKAAHMPVTIGSTRIQFIAASITLKDVKIHNPRSFPDRILLDAPLVSIDFDPPSFFKGQLHFEEMRIHLKEVAVVKNKSGQLNVDIMKPRQEDKEKVKATKKSAKESKKLLIDKLYLTIGHVVYKDYSLGGEPMVQSFDINMQDKLYQNIDNPISLLSLIIKEAIMRTTISRLANIDLGAFKEGASGILGDGFDLLGDGTTGVETTVKDLFGFLQK